MIDFNDWLAKYAPHVAPLDLKKFTQFVKNHHEARFGKVSALPTIAMEKLDGLCGLVICYEGNLEIFSRTGRIFQNTEHLKHMIKSKVTEYDNYAVCVELCNDDLELEEIGGVFNPDRVKPVDWNGPNMSGFHLGCYDLLTFDEFVSGSTWRPYRLRLQSLKKSQFTECMFIPAHELMHTEDSVSTFAKLVIDAGGEGIVRCLPEAPWVAGHKGTYKTKIVCGVDYDLEVLDIQVGKVGTKREGQMTNVVVRWRNWKTQELVLLPVDGCFTDVQRKAFFEDESLIIGKIVHIHALKLGSKGSLRLPKVKAIRIDKTEADV